MQTNATPNPVPQKIPGALIYEVVANKPVYRRGFREVLSGAKTMEEVMSDSTLQAWLKAQITILLGSILLDHGYELMTGELGIMTGKRNHRAADIAIFRSEKLILLDHYSKIPPEVVIEIDVKAALEQQSELDYVARKIDDYLRIGVKQVIWVFTGSQKIIIATPKQPWLTVDWQTTVETLAGASFNLAALMKKKL